MTISVRSTRSRPNFAAVAATLALVVAVGGGSAAVAAGLAKNSVGSPQIKNGQVKTVDLARNAVTGAKIKSDAVTGSDVKNGSLTGDDIVDTSLRNVVVRASTVPNFNTPFVGGAALTAATVTLTAPAAGVVVVTGQAVFNGADTSSYVHATIAEDGTEKYETDWDSGDVDGFFDQTQSLTTVLPVTAGPHTYTLLMNENLAASPAQFYNAQLVLQYVAAGSSDALPGPRPAPGRLGNR